MFLYPSIFETVSIGTPFIIVTVVAKVWRVTRKIVAFENSKLLTLVKQKSQSFD
jgi:hypothetical protein